MKHRRYLSKVSITIVSLVLIPILVLSLVIRGRAARELKRSNQAYYEQLVHSFAGDITERLEALQSHALTIILDSKTDKSVFHKGLAKAKEHPYWYYQAVNEMSDKYAHYNASRCGVYYYQLDRLVTDICVWNKTYFLNSFGIKDENHFAWDIFLPENHTPGKWIVGSTYQEGSGSSVLLAGYCAELGKNRDQVMILYSIPQEGYAALQDTFYDYNGICFQILDADGKQLLMSLGMEQESEKIYTNTVTGVPLTFRITVADSSLQSNEVKFYRDYLILLTVLVAVMCLLCLGSIYLVYRPVRQLTSELDSGNGGSELDEFEQIRDVLGERRARIQEQENLIMDLLLKHLIHGVPISQKAMNRLGVDKSMDHYCVFVIDGHVLPASEVEKLSGAMEADLSARLFCTDWNGENKSILILFQTGPDTDAAKAMLTQWLRSNGPEHCLLRAGTTVDRLDGIRESFLSCLEQINGKKQDQRSIREELTTLENRDCQQKLLETEILDYLEKHFRDEELSQVLVADAFGISTYSLSRLFKSRIGIGFAEYVNTKKLEYAKNLLLTTSLPIRQIALESGYASESYFSRVFKATYGVSPSAFKEQ